MASEEDEEILLESYYDKNTKTFFEGTAYVDMSENAMIS